MRSINKIETFANGSIIAPCHLFEMGSDIFASTIFFRRISVRMILMTGTVFCLVFYVYLRRLLSYEKMIHQAELFRHNWCVETEEKEIRLEINEQNRIFDTSLLDTNIDDSTEFVEPKTPAELTRTEDADGDEELLGLLPRDKLATFPNPIRMKMGPYILLIFAMILTWLLLLTELTLSSMGYSTLRVFSYDNFAFFRMLEILRSHKSVMGGKVDLHKCFGTMEDLKSNLSSSVMTAIQVFVWERSLAASIVPVCVPILALGILVEVAVQGVYHCRLNHQQIEADGKRHVYMFRVGNRFLLTYFVFTSFLFFVLVAGQYFWRADRLTDRVE